MTYNVFCGTLSLTQSINYRTVSHIYSRNLSFNTWQIQYNCYCLYAFVRYYIYLKETYRSITSCLTFFTLLQDCRIHFRSSLVLYNSLVRRMMNCTLHYYAESSVGLASVICFNRRAVHRRLQCMRASFISNKTPLCCVLAVSLLIIICPIAMAYSMGQIIKLVCVCQSVSVSVSLCICPSVSTLTVAFLDRFSPKLAQT